MAYLLLTLAALFWSGNFVLGRGVNELIPPVAYIFWNRAVAVVGANRAGIFVHLMPVFSITLAFMFLGETLAVYHLAGMALIFSGIYLTTANK